MELASSVGSRPCLQEETMKPYKGLVKISCKRKDTCPKKLTGNVKPECLHCPEALTENVSLEGKVLASARLNIKKVKPPKNKEG